MIAASFKHYSSNRYMPDHLVKYMFIDEKDWFT